MDCTDWALEREILWAFVNKEMNLQVTEKSGALLTSVEL
jgi:hypothetical protein